MAFFCVFVWGVNTSLVSLYSLSFLSSTPLTAPLLFWSENVSPLSPDSIRFFSLFCLLPPFPSFFLSCERFYSLESLFPWFPCRQAVKAAALWGAGQGWAAVVREKVREPFTGLTDLLLSPRVTGQYPASQLTGQLSRGELEHGEYQTAGCFRQYTNSMSVLSKSQETHAVCTVSLAQNIHIQAHANLMDKLEPENSHSYRHNYVK